MNQDTRAENPLKRMWRYVTVGLGIVSLSSLFENIITWVTMIDPIIQSWKQLINLAWYPIELVLSFTIPFFVKLYVVFGIIFASSIQKANPPEVNIRFPPTEVSDLLEIVFFCFVMFMFYLYMLVRWPVDLFSVTKHYILYVRSREEFEMDEEFLNVRVFHWFLAIIVGFLLLVFFNAAISTAINAR